MRILKKFVTILGGFSQIPTMRMSLQHWSIHQFSCLYELELQCQWKNLVVWKKERKYLEVPSQEKPTIVKIILLTSSTRKVLPF